MSRTDARLLKIFAVLLAPLLLSGCNIVGGLINSVLGVALQAGQVKLLYRCVPGGRARRYPRWTAADRNLGSG